jgi:uncharacterized protein
VFSPRQVSWSIIGLFALVHALLTVLWNLGFRAGVPFLDTLTANLLSILVVAIGIFFWLGRLRPVDVGLQRNKLLSAVLFGLVLWGLGQLAVVLFGLFTGESLVLQPRGLFVVYTFLGQLLGNALYEEIAFRGFLLLQLYLKIAGSHRLRLILALVLSQAFFALIHIPNIFLVRELVLSALPTDLLRLFVLGLVFAFIYLYTGNLFVAVVVHAFANVPALIWTVPGLDAGFALFSLALLLVILWPRLPFWRLEASR